MVESKSNPISSENRSLGDIYDKTSALQGDVQELFDSLRGLSAEFTQYVEVQVRERPLVTLGVASGIGYLLGGGLSSRLTRMMFQAGGGFLLKKAMQGTRMNSMGSGSPSEHIH